MTFGEFTTPILIIIALGLIIYFFDETLNLLFGRFIMFILYLGTIVCSILFVIYWLSESVTLPKVILSLYFIFVAYGLAKGWWENRKSDFFRPGGD